MESLSCQTTHKAAGLNIFEAVINQHLSYVLPALLLSVFEMYLWARISSPRAQIRFSEKFESTAISHSFFSGKGLLSLHKHAGASAKDMILPTVFAELLLPRRERLGMKV